MATEQRDDRWMAPELATTARQRDPYPWFRQMREQGPVRYDEERDAYDVFRYDEIVTLATDWERFSRDETSFIDGAMMDRGPPEHTELRGMAETPFRPGNLREYRPEFERQADALLDEALAGDGRIEFVDEIAKPLPIMIIAEMLGVPTDMLETFREWSTALAAAPAQPTPEARQATERRKRTALQQVTEFFEQEISEREDDPRDDLITTMLKAESASDRLTRQHTVANCAMLLIAGNITTTTYMANALWTYAEEGVIGEIQDGRLDIETANEEVLRYRSPVNAIKRFATEDTELAGVDIPEGSKVVGYILSANRDERVFEAPDEFRPHRSPSKEPIPFGKGIHYCLGAPLANMEAEIMLSKFFDRVTDVQLVSDEIDPYFSTEIFGPVDLPVAVTTA